MRDCANVNVRELLPDLLHDRLPAVQRAEVESHLAGCTACREELAILRSVLAGAVAPRIDVGRIAAAVPVYRSAPSWRRAMVTPQLRVAAAIVLLMGGWAVVKSSGGPSVSAGSDTGRGAALTPSVATGPTVPVESAVVVSAVPPLVAKSVPTELAVGDSFHDVSDSELRALLDDLATFEALTPAETEIVVPAPGRSGA